MIKPTEREVRELKAEIAAYARLIDAQCSDDAGEILAAESELTTLKQERADRYRAESTCNKCGESCTVGGDCGGTFGLINVRYRTGYASPALSDGESYRFSICEPCLKEWLLSFVVPADRRDYINLCELPALGTEDGGG